MQRTAHKERSRNSIHAVNHSSVVRSSSETKSDQELIEDDSATMTEAIQPIVGWDWTELNETAKSNIAKALQHVSLTSLRGEYHWQKIFAKMRE